MLSFGLFNKVMVVNGQEVEGIYTNGYDEGRVCTESSNPVFVAKLSMLLVLSMAGSTQKAVKSIAWLFKAQWLAMEAIESLPLNGALKKAVDKAKG